MKITLLLGWTARHIRTFEWQAAEGATVAQALSHLQTLNADWVWYGDAWQVAVWGKPVSTEHVLKTTDRVEVLRGLRVDPKVARRERFQKQGARTAGLFATRRAGAKPGY
jgi:putative ubiquitin-RnfH superfamily antitoxin RatB of RatAB toxin-antitoxin module